MDIIKIYKHKNYTNIQLSLEVLFKLLYLKALLLLSIKLGKIKIVIIA